MKFQLDSRTEEMSAEALACRVDRHTWRRTTASAIEQVGGRRGNYAAVEVTRVCQSCAAERIDVYNTRTFELLSRKYHYPENYLLKSIGTGQNHLPRGEVVKALFVREFPDLAS